MKVGEAIVKNGQAYVITEMVNGFVENKMPLDEYIMNNTTLKVDHECKTIKEIINERCTDYMNGVNVHEY